MRVVVRPGGGTRLPSPLPVQLPRAPRHARRLRLPAVAHGHRRFEAVRRARGRPAARRTHRHEGHLGPRDANGRGDHRRQRSRRQLRRRCGRDPPRSSTRDAGRAHDGAARRAQRDGVLPQHRAAAHRLERAAATAASARVVELSAPAVRRQPHCHRQLRHDSTHAAAGFPGRSALHRHPRWSGPRRPVPGHRHDGVRAPDLHADLRGRPAPAARVRQRPGRLRRRLARLGLPRGRCPLRRRGGRQAGRRLGRSFAAARRGDVLRHHDPAHPSYAVQAHLHPPVADLAGRPRPPARPRPARPVRGA